MSDRVREILGIAVGGGVAAVAFSLWLASRGGTSARYEPSLWETGFVVSGTALMIWAVRRLTGSKAWSWALATFALAALSLFSLLGLFSLGPFVLILTIGFGILAVGVVRSRQPGRLGAILALGSLLIVIALLQPPTVDCTELGPRVYFGTGANPSITVEDDRRFGELGEGDSVVRFECDSDRLVRFERTAR